MSAVGVFAKSTARLASTFSKDASTTFQPRMPQISLRIRLRRLIGPSPWFAEDQGGSPAIPQAGAHPLSDAGGSRQPDYVISSTVNHFAPTTTFDEEPKLDSPLEGLGAYRPMLVFHQLCEVASTNPGRSTPKNALTSSSSVPW